MRVSGPVKAGFAVGAVAIIAVLAISIVTLVKVFNIKNSSDTTIQPNNDTQNPLNIYPQSASNTQAYQQAAQYFKKSIDVSVNPCDDFYKYACGKYNASLSFYFADNENYHVMANAFSATNSSDVSFNNNFINLNYC